MVTGSAYMHKFSSAQPVCLLVDAFDSFTFKVLSNMNDPINHFLIVLGLFCVGLFPVFCFLPRKVPLAFVVKLVW